MHDKLKILTVVGTRPEAIKMAMVIRQLNNEPSVQHHLCITGQHKEMLQQVIDFFELVADSDLEIMAPGQQLSDITSKIIFSISKLYDLKSPDIVLVHGDTNSCFASALAAFYKHIPVAHIEAGLRTFNLNAPFPEEANRVLTTTLATYHFAPTKLNVQNLLNEGIHRDNIILTGNSVIDSLLFTSKKVKGFSNLVLDKRLTQLKASDKIILVTAHRRENFGDGFNEICKALQILAQQNPEIKIIYPVHLNPSVNISVNQYLSNIENIILCKPLSYPDFVYLMNISMLILTDSGGIQEEGPAIGKPVIVMRDITERPEAVEAGTVKLTGAHADKIIAAVNELITQPEEYEKMIRTGNPYGDGHAAERIVQWIVANRKLIKKEIA